jgi:5'-deoxynucleotidase YfbR-like HD superfamily hydrolase
MAHSFHAGMLTQMMMPDKDETSKEETFIAALLHHIGESAFWSAGGKDTADLDELLRTIDATDKSKVDHVVMQSLGTTFDRISIGLADTWNLGDSFIRTLDESCENNPQTKIVKLADELSLCIANPKTSQVKFGKLLKELGKLTKLKPEKLKKTIEKCTIKTEELLESYGAGILVQYLHPGAAVLPETAPEPPLEADEKLQLQILRELTSLTTDGGDFNVVIQTSLEGIYRGIGMDKVVVMIKNSQKKLIEPRFISGEKSHQLKELFTLSLQSAENVFSYALKHGESIWVSGFDDEKWAKLITKPVRNITCKDGFFISPVMWDKRCIGLIYADRYNRQHNRRSKLNESDFDSFIHFTQQTNLCLSIILKRS